MSDSLIDQLESELRRGIGISLNDPICHFNDGLRTAIAIARQHQTEGRPSSPVGELVARLELLKPCTPIGVPYSAGFDGGIEAAIALLRQHFADQSQSPSGWQDIGTAPQDGTVVLMYRRDAGIFSAHFVSPSDMIVSDDDEPSWFTLNGQDLTSELPTHWMPLPKPPTKEAL